MHMPSIFPLSLLPLYDGGLTNISSLGLLTLLLHQRLWLNKHYGAQVSNDVIRLLESVVELRGRLYDSPSDRTNLSGIIPFYLEVVTTALTTLDGARGNKLKEIESHIRRKAFVIMRTQRSSVRKNLDVLLSGMLSKVDKIHEASVLPLG